MSFDFQNYLRVLLAIFIVLTFTVQKFRYFTMTNFSLIDTVGYYDTAAKVVRHLCLWRIWLLCFQVYKQVYAAELARAMERLHEKDMVDNCHGCKIMHGSQRHHSCLRMGDYMPFNVLWHACSYLHRAVDEINHYAAFGTVFAKGLVAASVPLEFDSLHHEFRVKAETEWFTEIWKLLYTQEIDQHSCLYANIILPVPYGYSHGEESGDTNYVADVAFMGVDDSIPLIIDETEMEKADETAPISMDSGAEPTIGSPIRYRTPTPFPGSSPPEHHSPKSSDDVDGRQKEKETAGIEKNGERRRKSSR